MEERIKKIKDKYLVTKEKTIINNFYSKEINKGKSYKAAYYDKIAIVLLLFIAFVSILFLLSDNLLLSVFISLISIYFITKGLIVIRDKKHNEKVQKVNEELKSNRIIREISLQNKEEFINYIKSILEKYYQSEFVYGEDGIDLIGIINNKKYGVKCIKSSMEDKIFEKKVSEFNNYINYLDYDEGIIVTNSYFQDGVKDASSLILFDFEGIKELLKSVNEFPIDDEINNYIIHKYNDRRNDIRNQIKVVDVKKIIKLYGIFIIFYSISFFVRFSIYYKIMAIVAFIIATILGGMKLTKYIKTKGRIPLQK